MDAPPTDSNREKPKAAIQSDIKQRRSDLELTTSTKADRIPVEWKIDGLKPEELLNLAFVQNQTEVRVELDENRGRTLKHCNVVRDFRILNPTKAMKSVILTIPIDVAKENLHIVAHAQSQSMLASTGLPCTRSNDSIIVQGFGSHRTE